MRTRSLPISLLCVCCFVVAASSPAHAGVPMVGTIGKAILKYFGKEGSEQATEYLSRRGGQEVLDRVTSTALRQGGDDAVEKIAQLAAKHGPDALAALDNTPDLVPILRALDEIPEAQVKAAIVKLAAGAPGRELAEGVGKFGSAALRSELAHPGVGLALVRNLGDDGAELAARLTSDQALALAKHAEEIARLPTAQRTGLLSVFRNDTERMVKFMGRFLEANPGKTLFTVATTTIVLAEPDRILGGDEIVLDADGNPIVVRKEGLAGRTLDAGGAAAEHVSENYIKPVFYAIMAFLGTFAALWMAIKLWHAHQREKQQTLLSASTSDENGNSSP